MSTGLIYVENLDLAMNTSQVITHLKKNGFAIIDKADMSDSDIVNSQYKFNHTLMEIYWSRKNLEITIAETIIHLSNLGFSAHLSWTHNNCEALVAFVQKIIQHNICCGCDMDAKYAILPNIRIDSINGEQRLRSVKCHCRMFVLQTLPTHYAVFFIEEEKGKSCDNNFILDNVIYN